MNYVQLLCKEPTSLLSSHDKTSKVRPIKKVKKFVLIDTIPEKTAVSKKSNNEPINNYSLTNPLEEKYKKISLYGWAYRDFLFIFHALGEIFIYDADFYFANNIRMLLNELIGTMNQDIVKGFFSKVKIDLAGYEGRTKFIDYEKLSKDAEKINGQKNLMSRYSNIGWFENMYYGRVLLMLNTIGGILNDESIDSSTLKKIKELLFDVLNEENYYTASWFFDRVKEDFMKYEKSFESYDQDGNQIKGGDTIDF